MTTRYVNQDVSYTNVDTSLETNLSKSGIVILNAPTNDTVTLTSTGIQLSTTADTNTLTANNWSGNINSVNTGANSTHYLGFFDSSSTGNGKPQKTAGLSCNPSTNTITATTFSGSLSGTASSSSTAVGVNLTTDDTSTTCYIPFSKTTTATGNVLYMDNVNGPLTYNPSNGVLSISGGARTAGIDTALPTTGTCNLWTANTITNINIMGAGQTTGNVNIGATSATTGVVNIRSPLVLSRQLQTTTSATYPPSASPTFLGYTIQTLGTAFTTTAIPSSVNTDLMSYAFTSANYGTYLFTAHVTIVPPLFTTNQAIIAISNSTASTTTPNSDEQSPNVSSGSAYLSVTCVLPIYSVQTIYLVGFFNGSTGSVNNANTHFTYTRIA